MPASLRRPVVLALIFSLFASACGQDVVAPAGVPQELGERAADALDHPADDALWISEPGPLGTGCSWIVAANYDVIGGLAINLAVLPDGTIVEQGDAAALAEILRECGGDDIATEELALITKSFGTEFGSFLLPINEHSQALEGSDVTFAPATLTSNGNARTLRFLVEHSQTFTIYEIVAELAADGGVTIDLNALT